MCFGAQEAEDLDGADNEGRADGQPGNDEVVVDLADRPGKGPAVGEVHEAAVEGVEEHHAAGEQERQGQHGVIGQALDRGVSGRRQQDDLGGGVEADAEDQADEVQLPGVVDGLHEPAEEAVHQPARLQLGLEFLLVVGAAAHVAEDLEDAHQHDQVQHGDQVQEPGRDQRSGRAARGFEGGTRVDHRAEYGPGGEGDADADRDDDRGVAEGEEEAAAQRAFAVRHQLAGGVVDAGDVVGVEGMPEPQEPGGDGHAEPHAESPAAADTLVVEVVRHHAQHVDAPARRVDRQDEQEHRREPALLAERQSGADSVPA